MSKNKIYIMSLVCGLIFSNLTANAFFSFSNGNYNNWNYPYVSRNPLNTLFRIRNSMLPTYNNYNDYNNNYNSSYTAPDFNKYNSKNADISYLLSKMEKKKFRENYESMSIDDRLSQLETEVFGASQSGDYITRVNRLKQAFASEANGNQNTMARQSINPFKSFFSAGSPTSMPVGSDYYNSFNDENSEFYTP